MASVEFNKKEFIIDTLNKVFRADEFKGWTREKAEYYIYYTILKAGRDFLKPQVTEALEKKYNDIYRKDSRIEKMIKASDLLNQRYLDKSFSDFGEDEYKSLKKAIGRDFAYSTLESHNGFIEARSRAKEYKRSTPHPKTYYLLCLFLSIQTKIQAFLDSWEDWRNEFSRKKPPITSELEWKKRIEEVTQEFSEEFEGRLHNALFIDEATTHAKSLSFGISNFSLIKGKLILKFKSLTKPEIRTGEFEIIARVHGGFYAIEKNPKWGYVILIKRINTSLSELSLYFIGSRQVKGEALAATGLAIESEQEIEPVREIKEFSKLIYKENQQPIDENMIAQLEKASWRLRHLGNPIVERDIGKSAIPHLLIGSFKVDQEIFQVKLLVSILSQFDRIIIEASFNSGNRKLKLVSENGFYQDQKGFAAGQIFDIEEEQEDVSSGVLVKIFIHNRQKGATLNLFTDHFSFNHEIEQSFEVILERGVKH